MREVKKCTAKIFYQCSKRQRKVLRILILEIPLEGKKIRKFKKRKSERMNKKSKNLSLNRTKRRKRN